MPQQQQYLSTAVNILFAAGRTTAAGISRYPEKEAEKRRGRLVWIGAARRATATRKATWREKKGPLPSSGH